MIDIVKFNKIAFSVDNGVSKQIIRILLETIVSALPEEGEGVIINCEDDNYCIFIHNDNLIIESTDITRPTGTVVQVRSKKIDAFENILH